MIQVDGYEAFRGTMRITPQNPKFPQQEIHGDWLYKPDYDCWYGNGKSFMTEICEIVKDETEFFDSVDNPTLDKLMEVERKFLSIEPEVRIRRNVVDSQDVAYFIAIKSSGSLVRQEVEFRIKKEHFYTLAAMVAQPFITKDFRIYQLPDGLELECSLVDNGRDTEFMYAEVEFPNVQSAQEFIPPFYFIEDITYNLAYKMKNYWERTRRANYG